GRRPLPGRRARGREDRRRRPARPGRALRRRCPAVHREPAGGLRGARRHDRGRHQPVRPVAAALRAVGRRAAAPPPPAGALARGPARPLRSSPSGREQGDRPDRGRDPAGGTGADGAAGRGAAHEHRRGRGAGRLLHLPDPAAVLAEHLAARRRGARGDRARAHPAQPLADRRRHHLDVLHLSPLAHPGADRRAAAPYRRGSEISESQDQPGAPSSAGSTGARKCTAVASTITSTTSMLVPAIPASSIRETAIPSPTAVGTAATGESAGSAPTRTPTTMYTTARSSCTFTSAKASRPVAPYSGQMAITPSTTATTTMPRPYCAVRGALETLRRAHPKAVPSSRHPNSRQYAGPWNSSS